MMAGVRTPNPSRDILTPTGSRRVSKTFTETDPALRLTRQPQRPPTSAYAERAYWSLRLQPRGCVVSRHAQLVR